MFRRLFGRKKQGPAPTIVVVRLNDCSQPIDRGRRYEDPLDELLSAHGWGNVTGGGNQLAHSGEIEVCDHATSAQRKGSPFISMAPTCPTAPIRSVTRTLRTTSSNAYSEVWERSTATGRARLKPLCTCTALPSPRCGRRLRGSSSPTRYASTSRPDRLGLARQYGMTGPLS